MNRSIRLLSRDRRWGRIKRGMKKTASRLARRGRRQMKLEG